MANYVSDYTALLSGYSWNGDEKGKSAFVTFSFETSPNSNDSASTQATFHSFTEREKTIARAAFKTWADSCGLIFIEVPAGQGDIKLQYVDFNTIPNESQYAGFGYYPYTDLTNTESYRYSRYIYINTRYESMNDADTRHLFLHEIGHTIGLKHSFEGDTILYQSIDNTNYTVMNYTGYAPNLGTLDPQAIQYLYGSNSADAAQLLSWSWNDKTNTLFQVGRNIADTIRGVNSNDVINAGAGDDLIGGFGGNDSIDGGADNDTLFGGNGSDTLVGGLGDDDLYGGNYYGNTQSAGVAMDWADYSAAKLGIIVTLGGYYDLSKSRWKYAWGNDIGTDNLYDVDGINGGIGNDSLSGDGSNNYFYGNAGDDTLAGFGGNDTLDGGSGDDVFIGGYGNDSLVGGSGNDLADFSLVSSSLISWDRGFNGTWVFSYNPYGFDVLRGIEKVRFSDKTITLEALKSKSDFSGDGVSDVLFRDTSGKLWSWSVSSDSTGRAVASAGVAIGAVSSDWKVQGLGDFNGDGKQDVLWRNDSGIVCQWQLDGASINSAGGVGTAGLDWSIVGIGDFDGDGKDDILWRNTNGNISEWLQDGMAIKGGGGIGAVGSDWTIKGTGDFDGDGKDDILWQNANGVVCEWLMDGMRIKAAGAVGAMTSDWSIQGIADFNGDGKDDILWRDKSGNVLVWQLDGLTKFAATYGQIGSEWSIQGTGDYNGDGRADILWRNSSGTLMTWTTSSSGIGIATSGNLGMVDPNSSTVIKQLQVTDKTTTLPKRTVKADINGDGVSDVMFRNTSGQLSYWSVVPDGAGRPLTGTSSGGIGAVSSDWKVQGLGDFNGDGKQDVLWRHDSGVVCQWQLDGASIISAGGVGMAGLDWSIVGIGDFDGDGKDDILWRNTNGNISEWLQDGMAIKGGGGIGAVGSDWTIKGTGDFDGDGKDDILWQNANGVVCEWLMDGTTIKAAGAVGAVTSDWSIQGIADFDGDGKDDILWRNTNGIVCEWQLDGMTIKAAGGHGQIGNDWSIQSTGDYNGDGLADILWRNTSGTLMTWTTASTGFGVATSSNLGAADPNIWTVTGNKLF